MSSGRGPRANLPFGPLSMVTEVAAWDGVGAPPTQPGHRPDAVRRPARRDLLSCRAGAIPRSSAAQEPICVAQVIGYALRSAIVDARVASEAVVIAPQPPAQLMSSSQDDRVRQAQTVMASAEFGGTFGRPRVKG